MEKIMSKLKNGIFSGFVLKIFACIFMTVDHVGVKLFPQFEVLRLVGRIAFPVFAYLIAEGCIYTKNKPKRLLIVLGLGLVCDLVYYIYTRELYGNILITFSVSIVMIYAVDYLKKHFAHNVYMLFAGMAVVFAAGYVFAEYCYKFDYGFEGAMLPVLVAFFNGKNQKGARFIMFCIGVVCVIFGVGVNTIQVWSLMSIPFIALYNGKPGVRKFKYWFYIFYPLHLLIIEGIAVIMQIV